MSLPAGFFVQNDIALFKGICSWQFVQNHITFVKSKSWIHSAFNICQFFWSGEIIIAERDHAKPWCMWNLRLKVYIPSPTQKQSQVEWNSDWTVRQSRPSFWFGLKHLINRQIYAHHVGHCYCKTPLFHSKW